MATTNTGFFFSEEDRRRNTPNRPDNFLAGGPAPQVLREDSAITQVMARGEKLVRYRSGYTAPVEWVFGRTLDGRYLGERLGDRGVLTEKVFRDAAHLHSELEWRSRNHWVIA